MVVIRLLRNLQLRMQQQVRTTLCLHNPRIKKFIAYVYSTCVQGIVFFVPVFFCASILFNAIEGVQGVASSIVDSSHIDDIYAIGEILGFGTMIMLSIIFFVLILYLNGLIVKFVLFASVHDWLERNIFEFIPGYIAYKVYFKTQVVDDPRIPALVRMGPLMPERPALLLDGMENEKSTVFVPNTPDSKTGEVWVVESANITLLKGFTARQLLLAMQCPGPGITSSYEEYRKEYDRAFPNSNDMMNDDDDGGDYSHSPRSPLMRQHSV